MKTKTTVEFLFGTVDVGQQNCFWKATLSQCTLYDEKKYQCVSMLFIIQLES